VQCFERNGQSIRDSGFPSEDIQDEELRGKFALDCLFGYAKFVTDAEGKVWPIEIMYGLPTVSLALCNQVIIEIERRNMLGPENIGRMKEVVTQVSGELEEFVKTWSCGVGRPVRPLFATDGVIQWL
jgi:hypothetical protein